MKHKVLILTDHKNHSSENSLYDLSIKMFAHPQTENIMIASRANDLNDDFFNTVSNAKLFATKITKDFSYQEVDHPLSKGLTEVQASDFDLVWLRMPPPLSENFLHFITTTFSNALVINKPEGIFKTGSKEFLLNYPDVCPPMKICKSAEDIIAFKTLHPIVLKPFREYGGKGIVKVNGNEVSKGNDKISLEDFIEEYKKNPIEYLAVKYLKNVDQGDKRIIVVNGEILGVSLRLPPKDSWICNVSMGGTSNKSEVEPEEIEIIKQINPSLKELGIVMYGVDTLVDDDGKRVLSEINSTSIGGLPQAAKFQNEPLVERAIDLIWEYFNEQISN